MTDSVAALTRDVLDTSMGMVAIHRLDRLREWIDVSRLPCSLKILLESLLRQPGATLEDVESLARRGVGGVRSLLSCPEFCYGTSYARECKREKRV